MFQTLMNAIHELEEAYHYYKSESFQRTKPIITNLCWTSFYTMQKDE